jgi:hypothetical protein
VALGDSQEATGASGEIELETPARTPEALRGPWDSFEPNKSLRRRTPNIDINMSLLRDVK